MNTPTEDKIVPGARLTRAEWAMYRAEQGSRSAERSVGMLDVSRCTVCGTVAEAGTACHENGCAGTHPVWEGETPGRGGQGS